MGGRMKTLNCLKAAAIASASLFALASAASAMEYNIPGGDLKSALDQYAAQTHVSLIVSGAAVKDVHTSGAKGELTADAALSRILTGTGFTSYRNAAGEIGIVRGEQHTQTAEQHPVLAMTGTAAPMHAASSVETIVVTSSKIKGDIQTVPIAITALSQEQLTSRQIAGGPDLVKEVPNLTFTKTNFTGYNIQIRGIGTQAISATTDPAVAVALNDVPFLRNHFFEQEFFDVSQVQVVRGPQGTLFGRNATAGVVNVISAKPTDQFEAMLSADWGNYSNRRYEGMVNVPVWSDKIDLRVAGEWTKRDGYTKNIQTNNQIDGRDLFSTRVSLLVHPFEKLTATAVWEHFQESDDRLRSGKQLCARDNAPAEVDGPAGPQVPNYINAYSGNFGLLMLSQGCHAASLYSPESFETPMAGGFPYLAGYSILTSHYITPDHLKDPYAGIPQPNSLREISSQIPSSYRAKNDTFEFNVDYSVTPALTLTSQTAYSKDFIYSTEDFSRYNTLQNFIQDGTLDGGSPYTLVGRDNEFCDPQFGCSSRWLAVDRSSGTSRQFYQELRLSSDFKGPFNFVAGGNYLSFHDTDDYYVFSNLLTLYQENYNQFHGGTKTTDAPHIPFDATVADACDPQPADPSLMVHSALGLGCAYIDPNPLDSVNGQGHNYFLSHNPYRLKSWAGFGEAHYHVAPEWELTGGLRYTDDKKVFEVYPSWALMIGKGIPRECAVADQVCKDGIISQEWQEWTGRAVVNWTPKLDFTDQTLVYGSYARGYKGGGANPPGVTPIYSNGLLASSPSSVTHPDTFKPEFNNAFELGTKNTLDDGGVTLNADVFYYKYRNYQISQIVDRTAVNLNVNASVRGAEIESSWSPIPGLKLGFTGGYEDTRIDDNQYAIDLMDRTDAANNPGWMVLKPWITETSNCVLPDYVVNELLTWGTSSHGAGSPTSGCLLAYTFGHDPITGKTYVADPNLAKYPNYHGFDPLAGNDPNDPYDQQNVYNGVDYGPASNNGEGFPKNIGGNQLPNAPHFTTSLSADYTMPVSEDWAATIHGDFYWQSQSWWRIFNDKTYDKLRGYSNVNLALILTSGDGWQVMGYVKNVFDTTAITGAFLNSDDTALTTNVFLTDPRLYGIRITKSF